MNRATRFGWWVALFVLVIGCARSEEEMSMGDDTEAGAVRLDESGMYARIVNNSLEVYFPMTNDGNAKVSGTIELTCRHLTEDYQVEGSDSFKLESGEDSVVAHLDSVPSYDEVGEQAQYVVDYKISLDTGTMKGSRSLFMLLDKTDLVLMAPNKMYEGHPSNLRAFVYDPRSGQPIPNSAVTLVLTDEEGNDERQIESTTDEKGLAVIELDAAEAGSLKVKALITTSDGENNVETNVQVVRENKLLLTSDKPMYQPGQTMHLRALALDRFDHNPKADESTIFEVMDAKGNKVFKQEGTTNDYGVAWARFTLGSQVILGTYTLRVMVGDVVTEKSVTVDRYALPKFSVDVRMNKKFYSAGQTVMGEVNADYFFGKPVAGGEVKIVTYEYQAEWVPASEQIGETNDDGFYAFEYQIPDYVVGQPLEGGKALILMEITVTDTAEHSQTVARNLLVVENALDIALVPESGTVVPGVSNNFFLFVNDPTGNPVQAECTLTVNGAELDDEDDIVQIPGFGPAVVGLTPHSGQLVVDVEAEGPEGEQVVRTFNYSVGESESAILLRTDRSVYKVGETVEVSAYVVGGHNHVFMDVIRKNQTVLTHTLDIEDGVGTLMMDFDQELAEELVLNAYMLAPNGQFIRDSRIIYVQPASDLHVAISTDKEEYLPGETALVDFEVTDVNDQPTQAALGIQVVDEAVYALSEIKPGLLKLYFYLEEELTNPTYQVGPGTGASFGQLFAQSAEAEPGSEQAEGIDNTTTAALAALGDVPTGQQKLSSWSKSLSTMRDSLTGYYDALHEQMRSRLESILGLHNVEYNQACSFLVDYFDSPRYVDAWGQKLHMEIAGDEWSCNIKFTSAGPDETMDTEDDYTGALDLWALSGERWKGGGGDFGLAMEDEANAGPPEATQDAGTMDPGTTDPSDDGGEDNGNEGIRIRSWFPETLFVAPSLITDEDGKVSLDIPLADSITEWRMTTLASSGAGQLGSRTDGIVVFQDFFVDIDFPKYLTQNDEISFPIAIYNYLDTAQTVEVQLQNEDWFELLGADSKSVTLDPGEVSVVYFPVKVVTVGWHSLTVFGLVGNQEGDAIKRTVEVKPDGTEVATTESARFNNDGENPSDDHITQTITFPANAIANSEKILVKVLPGLSSHIVQGMDSIFQLPNGCFEQTTSSAWPNVLALKYMQEAGTLTPEIEMQAIEYVNIGYQRILTFECESGGFNWWEGDNPGNAILSAVGIMMLTDTKSIYDTVDQNVMDRSADYLFSVQKSDGSWSEESHLHAGNENLGASSLRGTCYISWALAFGGYADRPGFASAMSFIKSNLPNETDNYTRAMCANALVAANDNSAIVNDVLSQFHDEAIVEDETVHWTSNGSTLVNSYGDGADVELTALVALAMGHNGSYPTDVNGAVEWLVRSKDPQGNWGYNTQASVLALRTFLMALTMNPGNTDAHVDVYFNGQLTASRDFDNFNKDVVWQVELLDGLQAENVVELDYSGIGALSWQVVSSHYIPWNDAPVNEGPLDIDVTYDATTLEVNDTVTATVTISNVDEGLAGMVLVTVGVPPGFNLVNEDLNAMKAEGVISMYETMGKQLILYFDEIPAGEPTVVTYGLIAQYPIKAQTGGAEVSMYYDSENNATQESQEIEVLD